MSVRDDVISSLKDVFGNNAVEALGEGIENSWTSLFAADAGQSQSQYDNLLNVLDIRFNRFGFPRKFNEVKQFTLTSFAALVPDSQPIESRPAFTRGIASKSVKSVAEDFDVAMAERLNEMPDSTTMRAIELETAKESLPTAKPAPATKPKPAAKKPRRKRTNTLAKYLTKYNLIDLLGEYGDKDGHLNVKMHCSSEQSVIVEWKSLFGCVNGVLFQDELSTENNPANPLTQDVAHRKLGEGDFVVECGNSERYQLVAEFIYQGTSKKHSDCSLKICPLDDEQCPEHTGAIIASDGANLFYTDVNSKTETKEEHIWPFSGKLGFEASWCATRGKSKK